MNNKYLILLAMLLCVVSAYAQSFTVDGINYEVTSGSPAEVTVKGASTDITNLVIPETVTNNGATYAVTSITSSAFSGCVNLITIDIAGSVKIIGYSAFQQCYNVTNITFHEGLERMEGYSFESLNSLQALDLPNTLTYIGEWAFRNANTLTEIIFPENITEICLYAFEWNRSLRTVYLPKNVQTIGTYAFNNCPCLQDVYCLTNIIPSLGSSVFPSKTTIHVPSCLSDDFANAEGWKDYSNIVGDLLYTDKCFPPVITCDNDLLTMSCETEGATIYYTTDGSIPDENAIRYTSPISYTTNQIIRAIAVAEGMENSIVRYFYDKEQLELITDEQGVLYTLIPAYDNFYYSVTGHSDEISSEIVIPDDLNGFPVRIIQGYAFYDCTSLTSIVIPSSVISIGDNAFQGCASLSSITISYGVTSLGGNVFWGCSALTSITIPSSIVSIPEGAFQLYYRHNIQFNDIKIIVGDYFEFCNNYVVGRMYELYGSYFPILIDKDGNEISEIVIPEGVTTIGDKAFYNCRGLTSITIPNSVTSIGNSAFSGCSGLTTIPNSVTSIGNSAFSGCSGLTSAILSDQLTTIGYGAFNGCSSLSSITIPNSVTSIDNHAFDGCSSLTSAILGDQLTTIGQSAFNGCSSLSSITIPNSVTSIGSYAFYGCSGLSSVKIGRNVRSIGERSFSGCSSLNSIKLPNMLENIGSGAFDGCSSLTSITLPNTLESIGDYAFRRNTSLTSVIIPGSVKSIGYEAFFSCSSLASVSLEEGLTTINYSAFAECALSTITIPNSVTSIERFAFGTNRKLTTVILGNGITKIANVMFQYCSALTSISIPDRVTTIESEAFASCSSLTSIKLPESLTSMGERVFNSCPLKSIEFPDAFTTIPEGLFRNNNFQYIKLGNNVKSIGKNAFGSSEFVLEIGTSTPPTIATDAFPNVSYLSDINVIVPDAAAENAYRKAAVWQEMTFSNQNNISEVTVDTPGDLSFELITECNMMPAKVVGLKVNGTINADDFNQMLVNMKSLLRLDLSDCNITAIPDNAMKGKLQLQEITLPTSLQTIGKSAFQGCTGLTSAIWGNQLTTIGESAFQGCTLLTGELSLPSTVTSIGKSAFTGTYYTSVKLPNALKTIGDYAFNNLPIKQQLKLPNRVTSVGAGAFAGTKITGLVLPDGVTSIGDEAFANTPIEDHVTIPDGVTYLGSGAFKNSQLSTVFLPNSVTTLSQGLFQGCPNLNLVYVPDNYTAMSSYAFDGCGDLTILRLSANTESMGEYSLQNTPLEYVKVPAPVEVLPRGVLKNCKNLESLSLPANLKSVEAEALTGCTALRNLSVEAIEPPVIKDKSAIRGINTDLCLISIPTQSFRAYVLAEYWGQFVQMRNDIAVETVGNGKIGFESADEEEEGEEASYARRHGRHSAAARGRRGAAPQLAEDEDSLTYANNGSSVYVPQQGKVRFYIIPAEGEVILSATLDGEDIMPYIVDGVYTATADKKNAKLVVVFSDGQGSAGLMGDVNGDGDVSVTDVGCVINYILEQVPDPFIPAAADMNSDGSISVTDVGFIINYILNDGAAFCRAEHKATYSYGEPMLIPDTDGYVLTLDGADDFIAFQMDIFVQEDADGYNVRLKDTGTNHQMVCRRLSDGHFRVVCYSPTNETFAEGLTDLLTFASEGDMTIRDIRFTTESLDEVRFADMSATPTSIASVTDLKAAYIRVYTLDGQLYRTIHARQGENPLKDLQPGIYLINNRKYIIR